jgi:hypothetical protein
MVLPNSGASLFLSAPFRRTLRALGRLCALGRLSAWLHVQARLGCGRQAALWMKIASAFHARLV